MNRKEEVEGVYSHHTALSLYDLSDLNRFSMACIAKEGFNLAPQVGLEPTTLRLTALATMGFVIVIKRYVLLPVIFSGVEFRGQVLLIVLN